MEIKIKKKKKTPLVLDTLSIGKREKGLPLAQILKNFIHSLNYVCPTSPFFFSFSPFSVSFFFLRSYF